MDDEKKNSQSHKITYFFVGVGKCGTSWLYEFLKRHNVLSLPSLKEPYLINEVPSKQHEIIDKLYSKKVKMCDFSTLYYWDPDNANKILEYNKSAKIIITVRRPSKRIISHFGFLKRNGILTEVTLEEYLKKGDPEKIILRSDYHDMINRYVSVFGKENVLILPLEQLQKSPQIYVNRLLNFLSEPLFILSESDTKPVLKSARARSFIVAKFVKNLANFLRRLGLLSLLGHLKSSKLIRSALFKTVESSNQKVSFGFRTSEIEKMDKDYNILLSKILNSDQL